MDRTKSTRKTPDRFFGKYPLTFDSVFPARSRFTTFWHQKVAPKVSAGHLRRDRTAVLTERAQKTALFCTPTPGVPSFVRSVSASGAMRICGALRTTMIYYDLNSSILSFSRPQACTIALLPLFSQCLIFWCFWIKTKAQKKENARQKKSILRKEFRRQDRLRRICGPKAVGHAHSSGPPQAETSTRTAQRPAIFQAGLWGFARRRSGLHGTLLREFPKSSFKQEISTRPAPFRRHDDPPDIPRGNRHTERSTRPPDKQREPFPMKRFPFSFPRRIPPDPA